MKNKKINGFTPVYLVALVLVGAIALVMIISRIDTPYEPDNINKPHQIVRLNKNNNFKKFESAEQFRTYMEEIDQAMYYGFGGVAMARNIAVEEFAMDSTDAVVAAPEANFGFGGGSPDRISETNVQVAGIDEPDIVKTDGSQIYFSDSDGRFYFEPIAFDVGVESSILPPQNSDIKTNIINAWPPSDLELSSEIDLTGDLLLVDNTLIVFANRAIHAYDVSDPKNPVDKWTIELEDDTYLVTSRLYEKEIYLITQTNINRYNPCPITPILRQGQGMIIPCTDIYYPGGSTYVDSTFTAMKVNADSGEIQKDISFVGSQSSSNIYMSRDFLYVAYTQNMDMFEFMFDFMNSEMKDLLPSDIVLRLNKLTTYDISNSSKLNELQTIMEEWQQSLDRDERLLVETEASNRMQKYYEKNKRSMVTTGIAKVDINNLDIKANGSVPGYLLNQFSMDEYDGYLRVATTIGDRWGWGGSSNQANDVYILDDSLNIKGAVTDLGLTERIYAVRFIGKLGYLVTFRQIDPFYVLDLSNPSDPRMVGELKIPGYSSYLHPLAQDRILGIGMENGQVKLSYFDVSDPNNPREIDKYTLSEYGTETLYNHHAFLQDADNEFFFLPSYQGGYIFSYQGDRLALARVLNVPDVKRALYLDNYMYIVANDYVAILNEDGWDKVNDIDL